MGGYATARRSRDRWRVACGTLAELDGAPPRRPAPCVCAARDPAERKLAGGRGAAGLREGSIMAGAAHCYALRVAGGSAGGDAVDDSMAAAVIV